MPILTAILIVLLVAAGMWAIYQYVKDPWKTIFLVVLAIGLVIFLLNIMGVLPSLSATV